MFICDSCYELAVKHKIESHDIRECSICGTLDVGRQFNNSFYGFVWECYVLSKKEK